LKKPRQLHFAVASAFIQSSHSKILFDSERVSKFEVLLKQCRDAPDEEAVDECAHNGANSHTAEHTEPEKGKGKNKGNHGADAVVGGFDRLLLIALTAYPFVLSKKAKNKT
jgi:hypothetical protein